MDISNRNLRFWLKVNKKRKNECWEWLGAKTPLGYGRTSYLDGKPSYAHRVVWIINFGYIPQGMWILHKCDNPLCVNPNHLEAGTAKDNAKQREKRGRGKGRFNLKRGSSVGLCGEKNPRAVLTKAQVLSMRKFYTSKTFSSKELSLIYGVGQRHINKTINTEQ